MTKARLNELQEAAQHIETLGIRGYRTVAERLGRDVADALIVANTRRMYGATEDPELSRDNTAALLERRGIIED